MKCDHCGRQINTYRHAPYGLPVFVCKDCYKKILESKVGKTTSENTSDEKENKMSLEHIIALLEILEMTMDQAIKDASQEWEDDLCDELHRLIWEALAICKGMKIKEL